MAGGHHQLSAANLLLMISKIDLFQIFTKLTQIELMTTSNKAARFRQNRSSTTLFVLAPSANGLASCADILNSKQTCSNQSRWYLLLA